MVRGCVNKALLYPHEKIRRRLGIKKEKSENEKEDLGSERRRRRRRVCHGQASVSMPLGPVCTKWMEIEYQCISTLIRCTIYSSKMIVYRKRALTALLLSKDGVALLFLHTVGEDRKPLSVACLVVRSSFYCVSYYYCTVYSKVCSACTVQQ